MSARYATASKVTTKYKKLGQILQFLRKKATKSDKSYSTVTVSGPFSDKATTDVDFTDEAVVQLPSSMLMFQQ